MKPKNQPAPSPAEETDSEAYDGAHELNPALGYDGDPYALPEPVSPGNVIHVPRIPGTVNTPVGPMIPAPVSPEGAAGPICQSRSSAGYQCIQSVAGHRKYHSTVAAPIEESNGGVFWCDDPAAPIAPAAEEEIDALINEVAPPPLVVSETAVRQLRPLLLELIARRKAEELIQEAAQAFRDIEALLRDATYPGLSEQNIIVYVKQALETYVPIGKSALTRAEEYRKGAKNG